MASTAGEVVTLVSVAFDALDEFSGDGACNEDPVIVMIEDTIKSEKR